MLNKKLGVFIFRCSTIVNDNKIIIKNVTISMKKLIICGRNDHFIGRFVKNNSDCLFLYPYLHKTQILCTEFHHIGLRENAEDLGTWQFYFFFFNFLVRAVSSSITTALHPVTPRLPWQPNILLGVLLAISSLFH